MIRKFSGKFADIDGNGNNSDDVILSTNDNIQNVSMLMLKYISYNYNVKHSK